MAARFFPQVHGVVLLMIISVCLFVLASQAVDYEEEIKIIVRFCVKRNWRNILLVTDNATPTLLLLVVVRHFSCALIHTAIIDNKHEPFSNTLFKFATKREQYRAIVWCNSSTSCLDTVAIQNLIFYKWCHWLFVYEYEQALIYDCEALAERIRVDSNVYALVRNDSPNTNWAVYKMAPNLSNGLPLTRRVVGGAIQRTTELAFDNNQLQLFTHQSLRGRNVSILHLVLPFWRVTLRNGEPTSFQYDLTRIMGHYLQFSVKNIVLSQPKTDKTSAVDVAWFHNAAEMVRNKTIDVHGSGLPVSPNYLQSMELSSAYMFSYGDTAIIRNSVSDYRSIVGAYTYPFTYTAWISILGLFAALTLLSVISLVDSHGLTNPQIRLKSDKLYYRINIIVHEFLRTSSIPNNDENAYYFANAIFVNIAICFLLFVGIFYNSNLTAALAADQRKIPFESMDDLLHHGRFTFIVHEKSRQDTTITQSKFGIYGQILNSSKFIRVKTGAEGYEKVLQGGFAFIYPFKIASDVDCRFYIVKKQETTVDLVQAFSKNSPLKEIFSIYMMRLRSSGILHRTTESYQSMSRESCDNHRATIVVNVPQTSILFVILGSGIVSSLLILLSEFALASPRFIHLFNYRH